MVEDILNFSYLKITIFLILLSMFWRKGKFWLGRVLPLLDGRFPVFVGQLFFILFYFCCVFVVLKTTNFFYISKILNGANHCLAKFSFEKGANFEWKELFPDWTEGFLVFVGRLFFFSCCVFLVFFFFFVFFKDYLPFYKYMYTIFLDKKIQHIPLEFLNMKIYSKGEHV